MQRFVCIRNLGTVSDRGAVEIVITALRGLFRGDREPLSPAGQPGHVSPAPLQCVRAVSGEAAVPLSTSEWAVSVVGGDLAVCRSSRASQ